MLTLDIAPAQRDLAGSSIAIADAEEGLSPPTDAELIYYGPQKRWVSLLCPAFLLAALSVYNFQTFSMVIRYYFILGINVLRMLIFLRLSKRRFTLVQHKTRRQLAPGELPQRRCLPPLVGKG